MTPVQLVEAVYGHSEPVKARLPERAYLYAARDANERLGMLEARVAEMGSHMELCVLRIEEILARVKNFHTEMTGGDPSA